MPRPFPPPVFATAHGTVRRCPCCGDLELAFGPTRLTLPDRAVRQLTTTVRAVARAGESRCWGWCLHVESRHQRTALPLGPGDAARLLELLEGTVAMLELSALLEETLGQPLSDVAR